MSKCIRLTQVNIDFIFWNSSEVRPLQCKGTVIDLEKYGRPWLQGTDNKDSTNSKPFVNEEMLHAWARTLPPSSIYLFGSNVFEFSQESVDYYLDEPFLASVRKTGECWLKNELSHNRTRPFSRLNRMCLRMKHLSHLI